MIRLRAKKLQFHRFSLYLDYNYHENYIDVQGQVRQRRKLEFLKLYVSNDYTKIDKKTGQALHKKIAPVDKETWLLANHILKKRELAAVTQDREFIEDDRKKGNFIQFFEAQIQKFPEKDNSSYKGALSQLRHFTGGNIRFEKIDELWVQNFIHYLRARVSDNTVNIYLSRVRIIYNVARSLKIIVGNPFEFIQKPKSKKKNPVFLVLNELKALQLHSQKIPSEVVQAFFFSCQTGLRFSDIRKLHWEEVESRRYTCQKTGREETLYLSEKSQDILATQRKLSTSNQEKVFDLPRSEVVNRQLKKWAGQAGVKKNITFHVGRHTCATLLITAEVDIYTVSKILGHSSVNMTEIYAQVLSSKQKDAIQQLPNF